MAQLPGPLLQRLRRPFRQWTAGSYALESPSFLGGLLVVLLVLLPFLENAQIGVLTLAIAIGWGMRWLGDCPAWTPIHGPLMAYWILATIATLLSPVRLAAFDGWIKLTLYFVGFAAFHQVLSCGAWRSRLVGAYLISTLWVNAYGVQQYVLGAQELATWTDPTSTLAGITRVYSFLGNPNLLAGYLIPSVPLAIAALGIWRRWSLRLLAAVVALSSIFVITQTFSRGGLLAIAVDLAAIALLGVWWFGRTLPGWAFPTFCGGSLATILVAAAVIPPIRQRLGSILLGTGDSSNNFRVSVWGAVLRMIQARPILGIGPGNRAFNQIYPLFQRSGFSALGAYSVPLELAVETGVLGLICYGWLVVTILVLAWRQVQRCRAESNSEGLWLLGAIAAILGMATHGLVDTIWYRPQVHLLWWLAVALVASFHPLPGTDHSHESP
ncbi:MAG: putative bicarbonate transporter, IctB family [Oscillatoriales cyanobacterium SM2_2_1]|nr:putative bicarbonate transporter, IctB family [Oscillatoriales cyanobacterium SM2_2_1]